MDARARARVCVCVCVLRASATTPSPDSLRRALPPSARIRANRASSASRAASISSSRRTSRVASCPPGGGGGGGGVLASWLCRHHAAPRRHTTHLLSTLGDGGSFALLRHGAGELVLGRKIHREPIWRWHVRGRRRIRWCNEGAARVGKGAKALTALSPLAEWAKGWQISRSRRAHRDGMTH